MERFEKKINKVTRYEHQDDLEMIHMYSDDVYEKFIKEIANGKLGDLEEIKNIAKNINKKLIKKYKRKWFA